MVKIPTIRSYWMVYSGIRPTPLTLTTGVAQTFPPPDRMLFFCVKGLSHKKRAPESNQGGVSELEGNVVTRGGRERGLPTTCSGFGIVRCRKNLAVDRVAYRFLCIGISAIFGTELAYQNFGILANTIKILAEIENSTVSVLLFRQNISIGRLQGKSPITVYKFIADRVGLRHASIRNSNLIPFSHL